MKAAHRDFKNPAGLGGQSITAMVDKSLSVGEAQAVVCTEAVKAHADPRGAMAQAVQELTLQHELEVVQASDSDRDSTATGTDQRARGRRLRQGPQYIQIQSQGQCMCRSRIQSQTARRGQRQSTDQERNRSGKGVDFILTQCMPLAVFNGRCTMLSCFL